MKRLATISFGALMSSCTLIVDPEFTPRNRISGTYTVREYSETYNKTFTYNLYVTSEYDNSVQLENFYDVDITVTGHLYGDKITIDRQYVGSYEVEGTGTVQGSELQLTYSVRDSYGYRTDFCNSIARK